MSIIKTMFFILLSLISLSIQSCQKEMKNKKQPISSSSSKQVELIQTIKSIDNDPTTLYGTWLSLCVTYVRNSIDVCNLKPDMNCMFDDRDYSFHKFSSDSNLVSANTFTQFNSGTVFNQKWYANKDSLYWFENDYNLISRGLYCVRGDTLIYGVGESNYDIAVKVTQEELILSGSDAKAHQKVINRHVCMLDDGSWCTESHSVNSYFNATYEMDGSRYIDYILKDLELRDLIDSLPLYDYEKDLTKQIHNQLEESGIRFGRSSDRSEYDGTFLDKALNEIFSEENKEAIAFKKSHAGVSYSSVPSLNGMKEFLSEYTELESEYVKYVKFAFAKVLLDLYQTHIHLEQNEDLFHKGECYLQYIKKEPFNNKEYILIQAYEYLSDVLDEFNKHSSSYKSAISMIDAIESKNISGWRYCAD